VPLNIDLPEDFTAGATGHVEAHEATNVAVNAVAAAVDALEATVLRRVVEANGVYPTRPATGYADFLGITDPSAVMQTGDTWTQLPATAPNAPTIGSATGGNAQASVAFTAPTWNGGASITGYTATSTPGSVTGTGTSSPITVTGLTNGTAYTFTVHATNSVGNSAESAASNSVAPSSGATVPGAPTIGTATAGVASASVTFTPPGSNGGATITGYTATSTPDSVTGTGTSSPITVSGLTAGTAYTFTVHATNSAGNSAESAASNSVTPTAGGGGGSLPTVTSGTLFAQFAADSLSLSDGASVTTWTKTAGSMTGNLTSVSTAPVFKTGQLNGHPSVRFSAGYFDALSAGTLSQPYTRFVVCRHLTTPTNVAHWLVDAATAPTAGLFANAYNTDFEMDCGGATRILGPGGTVFTNPHVVEGLANGTSSSIGVDSSNVNFTGDAGTNAQTGLRVGAQYSGDVNTIYQGDIFEVIIYAGALNSTDRTAVRQYLGTKYGITVS
jgi:trimeric autotransporter adhesin